MENKLKPCPFCGNNDIIIAKRSHNGGTDGSYENWLIECRKCFAQMDIPADSFYGRKFYSKEEAIAMWNCRKEVKE